MRPDEALTTLLAGNRRYVDDEPRHPPQQSADRRRLVTEQHPFAVVLGCADSRVPPEIVFDAGIGDLFVVRSAGHALDDAIMGSLEFAVAQLHVPLIMVLGHESCGAVTAAVDAAAGETPSEAPGRIGSLISAILPAAQEATRDEQAALARPTAQKGGAAGDRLERAVHANVEMVVQALRAGEPVLGPAVQEGRLRIVGGYYHLANGTVDMTVP